MSTKEYDYLHMTDLWQYLPIVIVFFFVGLFFIVLRDDFRQKDDSTWFTVTALFVIFVFIPLVVFLNDLGK